LTKSKKTLEGQYSRLELAQYRLRKLAMDVEDGVALLPSEQAFIVNALKRIGEGGDANGALGVKANRGERKTSEQVAKRWKRRFAMAWIASAISPEEEEGLGMTLQQAIEELAKSEPGKFSFGLSEDTLQNYWNNHPEMHSRLFGPPISSLPIRRTKVR
jgi:hypothetical protein